MSGEVVDRHERHVQRGRQRLGKRDADQQRADQTRPLRHGDRIEIRPRDSRVLKRAVDHAADVPNVLPRGQFGHNAAPLAMDLDL